MSVVLVNRHRVIAVPTIDDSFLLTVWDPASQLERRLDWIGLAYGGSILRLHVDCPMGVAIGFAGNNQS